MQALLTDSHAATKQSRPIVDAAEYNSDGGDRRG